MRVSHNIGVTGSGKSCLTLEVTKASQKQNRWCWLYLGMQFQIKLTLFLFLFCNLIILSIYYEFPLSHRSLPFIPWYL
jgi:hypothetical protein